MLVDVEIRGRLSHFCLVNKLTPEKAANKALREIVGPLRTRPCAQSEDGNRVQDLKDELASL